MPNQLHITAPKAMLHSAIGIALFILIDLFSSLAYAIPNEIVAEIVHAAMRIGLVALALYFYCKIILKTSLRDCRVKKPATFVPWLVCAFALPVLVCCFFIFCTPGVFAAHTLTEQQRAVILTHAVLGTCLTAGITEELLFRGFIMRILEARWGKYVAIIVPSLIFGIVHVTNMGTFNFLDVLQLVIAGTAVGVMFSLITMQAGSIWPSALVHGVWNVIIMGKILDIGALHSGDALYTYTLTSESTLLTGGAFGIEASLPAMTGYFVVILIAVFLIRKNTAATPGPPTSA